MREILFRGKTQQYTRWIYGDLNHYMCDDGVFIAENGHSMHRVFKETVGQYTGLTDKNGTKIFEGDIVMFGFSPCVVKYDLSNGRYMFYDRGIYLKNGFNVDTMKTKEVVGNITDNPELLGGD